MVFNNVVWQYAGLDLDITLLGHFRKVIVRTLREYTDLRRQLGSKTIYILVSAHTKTKAEEKRNRDIPGRILLLFIFHTCESL